jgi:hypothetical protein
MKRVFKKPIPRTTGLLNLTISLDDFLSFQAQDDELVIWFLDDDKKDHSTKEYHYILCFTGQPFDVEHVKYLSTTQDKQGLVWHLFYAKNDLDMIQDLMNFPFMRMT